MNATRNTVRYGIIGFGGFAERSILPAMRMSARSELIAIQKRSIDAAWMKAEQYGIPLAFDSVEELVACEDVDAVFIVSANSVHCRETLIAASARKHVLVEKPMAVDAIEAQRMIDACREAGVCFAVGHMLRFSPLLQRMKEIIASGEAGEITSVRSEFIYDARMSTRQWLMDRKTAGGGPTADIGVHCVDALRFVLDDEIDETYARLMPPPTNARTESSSLLSLKFLKGAIGSVYTSFETPIRRTMIECIGRNAVLSAADFTVSNSTPALKIIWGKGGSVVKTVEEHFAIPNLYEREISHMSDCILNGCQPAIDGANGMKNQIVLDAAMAFR